MDQKQKSKVVAPEGQVQEQHKKIIKTGVVDIEVTAIKSRTVKAIQMNNDAEPIKGI